MDRIRRICNERKRPKRHGVTIFHLPLEMCILAALLLPYSDALTVAIHHPSKSQMSLITLYSYNSDGGDRSYDRRRSSKINGVGNSDMKSKRQERVGQIIKTELSQIIHTGLIKGTNAEYLEDDLRTRISVVSTDVSPDLRQARISISVRPTPTTVIASKSSTTLTSKQQKHLQNMDDEIDDDNDDDDDIDESDDDNELSIDATVTSNSNNIESAAILRPSPSVDRRRAYAWLVRNTKPIRHTLAQRISHMKSCPELTFVQVDVSAAVDVMYLINKLSSTNGTYKRENLNLFNENDDKDTVARGIVGGLDFDAMDDDDDDWEDEDDGVDFFQNIK